MVERIKLYSDRAERFKEIKAEIAADLGYEPDNPEVFDRLIEEWGNK